jgi:hypothetical protein
MMFTPEERRFCHLISLLNQGGYLHEKYHPELYSGALWEEAAEQLAGYQKRANEILPLESAAIWNESYRTLTTAVNVFSRINGRRKDRSEANDITFFEGQIIGITEEEVTALQNLQRSVNTLKRQADSSSELGIPPALITALGTLEQATPMYENLAAQSFNTTPFDNDDFYRRVSQGMKQRYREIQASAAEFFGTQEKMMQYLSGAASNFQYRDEAAFSIVKATHDIFSLVDNLGEEQAFLRSFYSFNGLYRDVSNLATYTDRMATQHSLPEEIMGDHLAYARYYLHGEGVAVPPPPVPSPDVFANYCHATLQQQLTERPEIIEQLRDACAAAYEAQEWLIRHPQVIDQRFPHSSFNLHLATQLLGVTQALEKIAAGATTLEIPAEGEKIESARGANEQDGTASELAITGLSMLEAISLSNSGSQMRIDISNTPYLMKQRAELLGIDDPLPADLERLANGMQALDSLSSWLMPLRINASSQSVDVNALNAEYTELRQQLCAHPDYGDTLVTASGVLEELAGQENPALRALAGITRSYAAIAFDATALTSEDNSIRLRSWNAFASLPLLVQAVNEGLEIAVQAARGSGPAAHPGLGIRSADARYELEQLLRQPLMQQWENFQQRNQAIQPPITLLL